MAWTNEQRIQEIDIWRVNAMDKISENGMDIKDVAETTTKIVMELLEICRDQEKKIKRLEKLM